MDHRNLFLTRTTSWLLRAEYLAALAGSVVLTVLHLADIRWPVFAAMFLYIDVLGYLPGAVAYRRAGGKPLPRRYHVLYNSTHSLLSAGSVAALWCLLVRPEWALLALAIHLFGDRGLFGNSLKPFGVSFEPVPHPAYERFVHDYAGTATIPSGRTHDVGEHEVAVG